MADYKKEYIKIVEEMTELIERFTRVRNKAVDFIIDAKLEENRKEKREPTRYFDNPKK